MCVCVCVCVCEEELIRKREKSPNSVIEIKKSTFRVTF